MERSTQRPRNLLLLSVGSKVAIARIAKNAALKRGSTLHISDTQYQVPSHSVADQFHILPTHSDTKWSDSLIDLCQSSKIGLVIPTRHSELIALAQIKPNLEGIGTSVSLSNLETLTTCIQKIDTYQFLKKNKIPTPQTCLKSDYPTKTDVFIFPLIAKPERGSSAKGVILVNSAEDLTNVPDDWILQKKVEGIEYTTNIYIRQDGTPLCAIPHERIVVESGEVVQARTRRIPILMDLCMNIAKELPGAQGIINIQAFHNEATGETTVIEINPRIGGGYPLCDAAKGHYLEWLCQEHLDGTLPKTFDSWTDRLLMMRYREALFSL